MPLASSSGTELMKISTATKHVRYNSWYISLPSLASHADVLKLRLGEERVTSLKNVSAWEAMPSFAKEQREMTKSCVVWRTRQIIFTIMLEFYVVFHIQIRGSFDKKKNN